MIDNPRLDLLIARHGETLVVVLAVVGALGLLASGWAVASPHEETVTREVGNETVETTLHASATVVEGGLWAEGDVLRDSPVYASNATPTLTLEPRTTVPSDDATVVHEVELRYEASRDGEPFWNRTVALLREDATVADGVATSAATIDVADVLAERRAIEAELAGVGEVDVRLELTARYDTGRNTGRLRATTDLRTTEHAYWLATTAPSDDDRNPEEARVTETEPRSALLIGLLALLGSGSLAGAYVVSRWAPVDETAARRAVHERRYAEWISRGSIPMWVGEHHIALDTLEDVVDVAIDTNERVVHDRQRGLFAVVDDDVVYYYTDRGLWEETAWPNMDLQDGEVDEFEPPGPPGGVPPSGPGEGMPTGGPGEGTPPAGGEGGPPPGGPGEHPSRDRSPSATGRDATDEDDDEDPWRRP